MERREFLKKLPVAALLASCYPAMVEAQDITSDEKLDAIAQALITTIEVVQEESEKTLARDEQLLELINGIHVHLGLPEINPDGSTKLPDFLVPGNDRETKV